MKVQHPKLPGGCDTGLWIRLVTSDGEQVDGVSRGTDLLPVVDRITLESFGVRRTFKFAELSECVVLATLGTRKVIDGRSADA